MLMGGQYISYAELQTAQSNGINKKALAKRLKKGVPIKNAITQPLTKRRVEKEHTNDIDAHELKVIIGRIKYLRQETPDFPLPYPKPLLKKADQFGIEVANIPPIPVEEVEN